VTPTAPLRRGRCCFRGRSRANSGPFACDPSRIEAVGGSGVFAVLTSFQLTTKAIRKGGENYITTPKTCSGKWTTKTAFTYTDGSTASVSSSQPCKK
jgi:hypothetical protein